MAKERLDVILAEKGLFETREKAKRAIMAGIVYVDNTKADKPGERYEDTCSFEVRGNPLKYVSRGGLKLEKAMKSFDIHLDNCVCMDIGASTGGFTDCMLQNGAIRVYSIDVGYGQLAWKLRNDEKVVVLERTNFRYLTKETVNELIDFASVDVSFISLKIIVPVLKQFLKDDAFAVCLIKPQFEAGREKVGKKGVVRDPEVHKEVIKSICELMIENCFEIKGLSFSPIKGPEGNIEYLIYVQNKKEPVEVLSDMDNVILDVVEKSWE